MFWSCSCKLVTSGSNEVKSAALVVQMVIPSELVSISWPSAKIESTEPLPLTGSSRFAIQTTVGVEDLFSHMAKQKALSPTGKNPAENSPFSETNLSLGFSTDRDVPLRVSNVLDEDRGRVCSRHKRRKKIQISIRKCKRYCTIEIFLLLKYSSSYIIEERNLNCPLVEIIFLVVCLPTSYAHQDFL